MGDQTVAAVDEKGGLVIVDHKNNRVRRLIFRPCSALIVTQGVVLGATCDRLRSAFVYAEDEREKLNVLLAGDATGHQRQIQHLQIQGNLLLSISADAAYLWRLINESKKTLCRVLCLSPINNQQDIVDGILNDGFVVLLTNCLLCVFSTSNGDLLDTITLASSSPFHCLSSTTTDGEVAVIENINDLSLWQFKANKLSKITDKRYSLQQKRICQIQFVSGDLLCLSDDGRLLAYCEQDYFYEIAPSSFITAVAAQALSEICALITSQGEIILIDLRVARRRAKNLPKDHLEYSSFNNEADKKKKQENPIPKIEQVVEVKEESPPPVAKNVSTEIQQENNKATPTKKKSLNPCISRLDRSFAAGFLNAKRLKYLLASNGSYPAKYRSLAWRILLALPENDLVFHALVKEKEIMHPLESEMVISKLKCSREKKAIKTVLHALVNWCPALDSAWLASAVYPILKVFDFRDVTCTFEVIITLFAKFAKGWLACWPEVPLQLLQCADATLRQVARGYTTPDDEQVLLSLLLGKDTLQLRDWFWPMLRSWMSEVFPKEYWLEFMDHVISGGPKRGGRLLMLAPIAFVLSDLNGLKESQGREELFDWAHRPAKDPAGALRILRRLVAACQTDPQLATAADSLPLTSRQELAVVAEEAYALSDAFPFPLPKTEEYPLYMAYPREALERAVTEKLRLADEVKRMRDEAAIQQLVMEKAREAERAARALAAQSIQCAIAEEKAIAQLRRACDRREQLLAEQRELEILTRLEIAAKTEARTAQALKAKARLKEIAVERLDLEAKHADRSTEVLADYLAKRERVEVLEQRALQRVESLRIDTELADFARNLDHKDAQDKNLDEDYQKTVLRHREFNAPQEIADQHFNFEVDEEKQTFRDFATEINQEELDSSGGAGGGSVTPPITTTTEVGTQGSIDFENLDRFISRARRVLDQATQLDDEDDPTPPTTLNFSPPPENESPSSR